MSDFIIPNGVTEISPYAFFGFIGITSVTIPDSVNRIGSYAFNGCGGLTSVIIPDSITNIAFGVFGTCSSMKSVTIPDSVTKIESRAFIGCSSLTDVYYAGTIDQWAALDIESNNEDLINATIHFDSTGSESAPEPEPEPRKDQTSFSDVDSSAYYAEAVHWAANHEPLITNGVGDGRFDPAGIVNRAQAVTFLWRAVGCPEPETSVSSFTDVTDPNAYYYKAVLWAAEKNITNGVGDGTFNLTGELSYGHMLTFLWRAITGKTASSYGTWYSEAMDWAKANSLDSGLSIDAIGYCPRGDVVYFLWRQMA